MSTLFLQPHSDDACLFGAYHLLRYRPHVVTILRSEVQERRAGITDTTRQLEDAAAFGILGVGHETLDTTDVDPDWEYVEAMLHVFDDECPYDQVFAPAFEVGGNEQHSIVGEIAGRVFGGRVTYYLTYHDSPAVKSTNGVRVGIDDPEWVQRKLLALACYRSQICSGTGSLVHFLEDLHEYVVA